jgi:hypothetical protein
MDNLGNKLLVGNYYQLEHFIAQYIGQDDNKINYLFEWTNPLKNRIIIRKTQNQINGPNAPILINREDDDTDDEFKDDPFTNQMAGKQNKSKRTSNTRTKRKSNRKTKRKSNRKTKRKSNRRTNKTNRRSIKKYKNS